MFVPDITDDELITEVIRAHAGLLGLGSVDGPCRLVDAQIRHSHRPASSRCRGWATYSVPADAVERGQALVYVRGYPDGHAEEVWADLVRTDRAVGATFLADHDLIVWTFPGDPSLSGLPELVDPARIVARLPSERVAALAGRQVMAEELELDVVRYQPETSATVRVHLGGRDGWEPVTLYAKALGTDPTETGRMHERLWSRSAHLPALRIARPLGSDPIGRVLWTLGVPGPPLGARVEPDAMASLAHEVAGVLVALHTSGVGVARCIRTEDCLAEGRKKAAKLGEVLPEHRSAVAAIAPAAGSVDPTGRAPVVVHGDLHLDQLVDGPDGPVLVDLDSVASGDAELDLAELVVDVVMRSLPLDAVGAFVAELLAAYARHVPTPPVRRGLIRALADAEFLTRCHRHLRRRARGWEVDLERALGHHAVLAAVLPMAGE